MRALNIYEADHGACPTSHFHKATLDNVSRSQLVQMLRTHHFLAFAKVARGQIKAFLLYLTAR